MPTRWAGISLSNYVLTLYELCLYLSFYSILLHFFINPPFPTPNSPNSTSSSSLSLSFLFGRGHSWRFIHVLIHVKSSPNPLPGNCSFCVLVFTHANINDNIPPSQPLWELLCSNEPGFFVLGVFFVFFQQRKVSRVESVECIVSLQQRINTSVPSLHY